MKLFYNSVIELNAGWGAEVFMERAFKKLGVQLDNLDYRKHKKHLAKEFRTRKHQRYNCFFLQRGEDYPLFLLKAISNPKFFWATELVSRRRDQHPLLRSKHFDHVFVRSQPCRELVINRGWKKPEQVSVMSSAYDNALFYPKKKADKRLDVVFVGSPMKRRKEILDQLANLGIDVHVTRAYEQELNDIYNKSKIVLNIHSENYPDTETRVYEVLGSGSCLISERLSAENPFVNGTHLIETDSVEEMAERIKYYLKNSVEREEIAKNGNLEASKNHQYLNRAQQIIDMYERYNNNHNSKSLNGIVINVYSVVEPLYRVKLFFLKYGRKFHRRFIQKR